MRHNRLSPMVAIVVLIAAGSAGCVRDDSPKTLVTPTGTPTTGSTSASPSESSQQIMQRALAAVRAAHTFHVQGQRTDPTGTTLIDLSMDIDQPAAKEILRPGGHTVELIRLADKIYIKADAGYWKEIVATEPAVWNASPDKIAAALQGKYLVAMPQTVASGADKTPAMLNQEIIYPDQAFGAFLDASTAIEARNSFNGTAVVTIRNLNQDSAQFYNADILYLTGASPLPVRIEGPRGFLNFLGFGVPVTVTAPPNSQTVDIATLRKAPH